MSSVEKIRRLCKERKTSVHKLEMSLGFSNGYIASLKRGTMPPDKLLKVARFFDVDLESLISDDESAKNKEPATEIGSGFENETSDNHQVTLNDRELRLVESFRAMTLDIQDRFLDKAEQARSLQEALDSLLKSE